MKKENTDNLSSEETDALLITLKKRFEKNKKRHPELDWNLIQLRLEADPAKLRSLYAMEDTGGEPDVIAYDPLTEEYLFYDCAAETPKGRRSLCYDREALDSRKEFKPENSVIDMAASMGIELLTEAQYRDLQKSGHYDAKTSSWLKTPEDIRKNGGAIFGDYRYGQVFIYHNGASSYYAARGFRAMLRV